MVVQPEVIVAELLDQLRGPDDLGVAGLGGDLHAEGDALGRNGHRQHEDESAARREARHASL